ncbi:hypothetical protein AAFH68_16210 [Flavobacterium sp. CGRL1]
MKIDTQDIVRQSELFAINAAEQISKITLKPFFETSFHSSEFRDKSTLKGHLHKIPENRYPLIYVFEIQSAENARTLIGQFEDFYLENKRKTDRIEKIKLSKYNKRFSNVLYVGSSTTDFKTRIKYHLGTEAGGVYSMHLSKWDNSFEYDLKISAYQVISQSGQIVERFIVEIIEQQIWDKLNPVFGKRSGL